MARWAILAIIRRGTIVFAVSLLAVMGWMAQPSFVDSLTPEEKIDRAYEESEGTGIAEEVYQQRLQAGQNPEKMPKPYTRIVDLEGKEVPETSFVEKSMSQVREAIKKVTGQ